jgi:DNA mismatch repair ATPase MutS
MFWRLKNNKEEEVEIITAVIKYLGVVDKLVNLVKLVYNSGFTFAEYLQDVELPKLECSGIFNPVLGSKCIKNDIKLYLDSILDTEIDTEINDIAENNVEENNVEENNVEENNNIEEIETNEIEENEIEDTNDDTINENTEVENIEEEKNNNEIETNKNYLDTFIEDKFDDIKQNCILTGPNGSGKSSMLKTILLNVILAQTLGIVPATNVKLTPFKYISSYLNIADAQGKESLFQAEMSRCHNHLEKLKSLETEEDGFSFNIMDEIFVSTNYFEGVSGAYAVIKALELYKKSINIVTTHFDALTKRENRGPTYCYKYFTIEDDGSKDYQIRSGINEKHCALTLLEDRGFDEELCNNAKLFYKQIKTKGN